MVTLAELLARKDPELAEAYGFSGNGGDPGTLPTESPVPPATLPKKP
jgi:hypothetical protein